MGTGGAERCNTMPTVLRVGAYRFTFYAADRVEPEHIHVWRGNSSTKFWLNPVRLANGQGFSARDLAAIERIIGERREQLLEAWHDYFD